MSLDPFSDALVHIKNSDYVNKAECSVRPVTKVLLETLKLFKEEKYIADFDKKKEENKEYLNIKLNGNITSCGAIKPRFAVDTLSYEEFEKKYLPGRNVGILVMSTSQGIMTHIEAKKRNIGGRLVAYVY